MTTEQITAEVNAACLMDLSVAMQPDGCFVAIDRNNYDVDCDHTGFFSKSPTGHGRTPLDAIIDLLDNMEPVKVACHRYYNPCLPGDYGWTFYDTEGNYGHGDTPEQAQASYDRERGE